MRNPDLPTRLRAMGKQWEGMETDGQSIYEQAAVELEKLEKIYKLHFEVMSMEGYYNKIDEILNEAP